MDPRAPELGYNRGRFAWLGGANRAGKAKGVLGINGEMQHFGNRLRATKLVQAV